MEYNYRVFDLEREQAPFQQFANGLHAGQRAPSFELEDLDDGSKVQLDQLWSDRLLVVEFGSFT